MEPLVYAIILNYNHRAELDDAIQSFLIQNYGNLRIIVVDNSSTDDSVEYVKRLYPEITLIENEENLGWSGGNNIGIRYALEKKADYVILANNDILINDSYIISCLIKDFLYNRFANVGIMGVRINYYSEKDKNHNEGWIIYPKQEGKKNRFNKWRTYDLVALNSDYLYVDSPSGCFFMIDSNLFSNVGFLLDELFLYADEIEYSLRAWRLGYTSIINKKLTVYHRIGTSSITGSPLSSYYRIRNLLRLTLKYNPSFIFILLYIKGICKALIINVFDNNLKFSQKVEIIRAIILGVWHGIINKLGKVY